MKVLLTVMLAVTGGFVAEGLQAWREGRHADALAAFAREEERRGAEAPAALLENLALAALAAGEPLRAEIAAEKAAARGGSAARAFRDFVLGSAASLRLERAARLAARPEAGAPAWDLALSEARAALGHFRSAVSRRGDWPEARRNAERVLLRIGALERGRDAARRRRSGREPQESEAARPEGPRPAGERRVEELAEIRAALGELSAEQVRGLAEALRRRELEKRELRRARQQARGAPGERDW